MLENTPLPGEAKSIQKVLPLHDKVDEDMSVTVSADKSGSETESHGQLFEMLCQASI